MRNEPAQKKPIGFRVLRILAIAAVLVMLVPFVLDLIRGLAEEESAPVPGTYRVTIVDRAELLTEAQEENLAKAMRNVAAYHPVAFFSVNYSGGRSASRLAEILFDEVFPEKNGILFLIDMDNREIWLQKANNNRNLTTALCNTVTDNVYRYASFGNYSRCAEEAFMQVYRILNGERVPETMKHMSNLFLSLAAAVLLVFHFAAKGTGVIRPKQVFDVDDNMTGHVSTGNVKKRFLRKIVQTRSDSSFDWSSGGSSSGSSGGGGWSGGSSSGGGHRF